MSDYDIGGLDLGAGNMKIARGRGVTVLPSYVSIPRGQVFRTQEGADKPEDEPYNIQFGPHRYWAGPGAHSHGRDVINLDDIRFAEGSPELKALIYALYTKAFPITKPMRLIVGLPQSAFAEEKQDPTDLVKGWLLGKHEWRADGERYRVDVDKVLVTSQVLAMMFDWLLNDEGEINPERVFSYTKREVGAVSVGANTVELNVTRKHVPTPKYAASKTLGVRRLLGMINGHFSMTEADAMLRAGALGYAQVLDDWFASIIGLIEDTWGEDWRRFGAILLAGGGAKLLEARFQEYFGGKATLVNEPIKAVSKGLYKFGLRAEW